MTAPSFSFTLTSDPTVVAPNTTATAAAAGLVQRPTLKRGLLRVPRRDGAGGFARVSGDALDAEKLSNLLLFDGFPWDPARTTFLDTIRHMPGNVARVFAQAYIADAVRRLLPEQRLEEVLVSQEGANLTITVRTSKVRSPTQILEASRVLR